MKFRGHETFYIRKGWLSKGMRNVLLKSDLFTDKKENPMDVLGLGSNMVKSLRYWLQTVGLTCEERTNRHCIQNLTELGQLIWNNDRYIEELGTLQILQYKLACNKEKATSWYFFFNDFNVSEFTREDFTSALDAYVKMQGEDVAERSLNDDFNAIVNTYLPRYKTGKKEDPENNIDSPFGELNLLDVLDKTKKIYKKAIPASDTFDSWIILAIIMDQNPDENEIALNELLNAPCNIGKVFNLDAITMLDILHNVEKTGIIKIIRTAGLDVVRINEQFSFLECMKRYYEGL